MTISDPLIESITAAVCGVIAFWYFCKFMYTFLIHMTCGYEEEE